MWAKPHVLSIKTSSLNVHMSRAGDEMESCKLTTTQPNLSDLTFFSLYQHFKFVYIWKKGCFTLQGAQELICAWWAALFLEKQSLFECGHVMFEKPKILLFIASACFGREKLLGAQFSTFPPVRCGSCCRNIWNSWRNVITHPQLPASCVFGSIFPFKVIHTPLEDIYTAL